MQSTGKRMLTLLATIVAAACAIVLILPAFATNGDYGITTFEPTRWPEQPPAASPPPYRGPTNTPVPPSPTPAPPTATSEPSATPAPPTSPPPTYTPVQKPTTPPLFGPPSGGK